MSHVPRLLQIRLPSLPAFMFSRASLQACRRSCTSMFANRPDKATAVRQTQNTNINKQTNPFIHSTPLKHFYAHATRFQSTHSACCQTPLFARSSVVWFIPSAFLRSCLIINRWCQRVTGLSVWQGISINTDFLSISVCTTLLTFNYGCLNVCYLSIQVCPSVRVCKLQWKSRFLLPTGYRFDYPIMLFAFVHFRDLNRGLTKWTRAE